MRRAGACSSETAFGGTMLCWRLPTARTRFRMFMRQNDTFPENFSVGLVLLAGQGDEETMLLRCNGAHKRTDDPDVAARPHYSYHIHRAAEGAIREGRDALIEVEITGEYATYEEAVLYFLLRANVTNARADEYFRKLQQMSLFPDGEAGT